MNSWFECKVKYDKEIEGGMQKTVSEPYMVDALSFTEAESRILEEMRPFISGEFTVANIKRVKISELFFDESGDRWYKCKVNFITLDEKSGVEKRTASYMMVQAADFKTALENLLKGMKGTMADYEIAPNIEHWHGASPDSWFSHIAVECNPQTNKNTWLEPVSDEEYGKAVNDK